MNKSPAAHPRVTFAATYSTSWSTLNASAAIWRCEAFLHDISLARQSIEHFRASGEWTPWFGLEIFSYYNVGFVTCLEWHARSRLVDLLTYKPSSILADDLKGQFTDKVLSQMVAAKVAIPEMVGASLTVGSADAYFKTIDRVFRELKVAKSETEIIAELRSASLDDPRQALQALFEDRHRLVHEISLGEVGAWNIRGNLDLGSAERVGRLVLDLMKLVERELTMHAPRGFPNKLTLDAIAEDPSEFLDQEIARLEKVILDLLKSNPEIAGAAASPELWQAQVDAFKKSAETEIEFIEACRFAGQRYIDYRGPILIALKRDRLRHLTQIAENFE